MSETNSQTKEKVIAERVQKLVSALYLVTGLFSDHEPMKRTLRESGLALLSQSMYLAKDNVKDRVSLYDETITLTATIIGELTVARISGTVSEMNSALLLGGFSSLTQVLEGERKSLLSTLDGVGDTLLFLGSLERAKNELRGDQEVSFPEVRHPLPEEKEVVKAANIVSPLTSDTASRNALFQKSIDKGTSESFGRVEKKVSGGVFKARKVSRREQILSLFVKGYDMSIKDISSKIKGCSEKTIQRELNALVFDHVIERIGEKRWSRYVMR